MGLKSRQKRGRTPKRTRFGLMAEIMAEASGRPVDVFRESIAKFRAVKPGLRDEDMSESEYQRRRAKLAGSTALIICARVGQVERLPAGYQVAECDDCHSPVWLNAEICRASTRRGMVTKPLCLPCAGAPVG